MKTDEDGIASVIGNVGAEFQRHKDVALAGHDHAESVGLEQWPELPGDIEGIILFVAVRTDRAFIETAMPGVEHDRLHTRKILDHAWAQLRLERFRQIDAGDDDFPVMDQDGIAQPITHAVNEHLAAINHKLELVLVVLEPHILAFDHRIGESVELRDVIDREEIASIYLDLLPLDSRAGS